MRLNVTVIQNHLEFRNISLIYNFVKAQCDSRDRTTGDIHHAHLRLIVIYLSFEIHKILSNCYLIIVPAEKEHAFFIKERGVNFN